MKRTTNLLNLPEVLAKDLWIYDNGHLHIGHRVPELDDECIDWKKARFWDEGHDSSGNLYHLVWYTFSDGTTRLAALYCEPDISPEDVAEWTMTTAGIDYYLH